MNHAAPDFDALFTGVAQRYRRCGLAVSAYVSAKLRRDPVHRDVLGLAMREPFGTVLDIGCGHGQMAVALLHAGLATSVLCIDCNETHLRHASAAAHVMTGEGRPSTTCPDAQQKSWMAGTSPAMTTFSPAMTTFSPAMAPDTVRGRDATRFKARHQDLAQSPTLPAADTVLLVDVLYQLDTGAQLQLLRRVTHAARRLVLVRTLDPDRGLRSAVTITLEKLSRRMSPNAGAQVNPMAIDRIAGVLTAEGFRVVVSPCWRGTPFANVLITARRDPVLRSADA